MSDSDYQTNHFRSYTTTVTGLSLGFIDTHGGGYLPTKGELIEYDGSTVVLKDGREFEGVPQLRGAITSGWLVPVENAAPVYRPRSSGIKVRDTRQEGQGRPAKYEIATVADDIRMVGSVEARRARVEGSTGVVSPMIDEVLVVDPPPERTPDDPALAGLVAALDDAASRWPDVQKKKSKKRVSLAEEVEADIVALLNSVAMEEMTASEKATAAPSEPGTVAPSERSEARTWPTARVETRMPVVAASNIPLSRAIPAPTPPLMRQSARSLPVVRSEQETLPLVFDSGEGDGTVVSSVAARRAKIETEKDFALDVAPAAPPRTETPRSRFGGTGAIIVNDERHLGDVALSSNTPRASLAESAQVVQTSTDSVRMSEVSVGRKTATVQRDDDLGTPVGRLMTPTVFRTNTDDVSSSGISRLEGSPIRIEKVAAVTVAVSGDVEEAAAGDELADLLPDAAILVMPEVYRPEAEDPAYEAIRALIPDFVWDRNRSVKVKVATALGYAESNPNYLKGIIAVESKIVREEIHKALRALKDAGGDAQSP